ncbi:hypothetical protein [Mycobacterium neglectum]|uniref:hypothetical protein n=1 Tax=Mycobacterium neglectum TaxID=242737 RepID=UPI001FEAC672|nr:hypothetical protein [Mycobacterium neglectum]
MGGHRRTTDVVEPLQHLNATARTGQVRSGRQPVVSAANDDDIECRRRRGSGVECRWTAQLR